MKKIRIRTPAGIDATEVNQFLQEQGVKLKNELVSRATGQGVIEWTAEVAGLPTAFEGSRNQAARAKGWAMIAR